MAEDESFSSQPATVSGAVGSPQPIQGVAYPQRFGNLPKQVGEAGARAFEQIGNGVQKQQNAQDLRDESAGYIEAQKTMLNSRIQYEAARRDPNNPDYNTSPEDFMNPKMDSLSQQLSAKYNPRVVSKLNDRMNLENVDWVGQTTQRLAAGQQLTQDQQTLSGAFSNLTQTAIASPSGLSDGDLMKSIGPVQQLAAVHLHNGQRESFVEDQHTISGMYEYGVKDALGKSDWERANELIQQHGDEILPETQLRLREDMIQSSTKASTMSWKALGKFSDGIADGSATQSDYVNAKMYLDRLSGGIADQKQKDSIQKVFGWQNDILQQTNMGASTAAIQSRAAEISGKLDDTLSSIPEEIRQEIEPKLSGFFNKMRNLSEVQRSTLGSAARDAATKLSPLRFNNPDNMTNGKFDSTAFYVNGTTAGDRLNSQFSQQDFPTPSDRHEALAVNMMRNAIPGIQSLSAKDPAGSAEKIGALTDVFGHYDSEVGEKAVDYLFKEDDKDANKQGLDPLKQTIGREPFDLATLQGRYRNDDNVAKAIAAKSVNLNLTPEFKKQIDGVIAPISSKVGGITDANRMEKVKEYLYQQLPEMREQAQLATARGIKFDPIADLQAKAFLGAMASDPGGTKTGKQLAQANSFFNTNGNVSTGPMGTQQLDADERFSGMNHLIAGSNVNIQGLALQSALVNEGNVVRYERQNGKEYPSNIVPVNGAPWEDTWRAPNDGAGTYREMLNGIIDGKLIMQGEQPNADGTPLTKEQMYDRFMHYAQSGQVKGSTADYQGNSKVRLFDGNNEKRQLVYADNQNKAYQLNLNEVSSQLTRQQIGEEATRKASREAYNKSTPVIR